MCLNNGHGVLYLQGTDNILGIQINIIYTELKRTVFVCFILKTRDLEKFIIITYGTYVILSFIAELVDLG